MKTIVRPVGTLVIMPIGGKLVLKGGLAVSSSGVEKLKKKKKTTKVADEPDEEQKKKHEEERECKPIKNAWDAHPHLASSGCSRRVSKVICSSAPL